MFYNEDCAARYLVDIFSAKYLALVYAVKFPLYLTHPCRMRVAKPILKKNVKVHYTHSDLVGSRFNTLTDTLAFVGRVSKFN